MVVVKSLKYIKESKNNQFIGINNPLMLHSCSKTNLSEEKLLCDINIGTCDLKQRFSIHLTILLNTIENSGALLCSKNSRVI